MKKSPTMQHSKERLIKKPTQHELVINLKAAERSVSQYRQRSWLGPTK